ncbi:MAG: right-handed parallel beta-helix repeat-containing protein, partial [bacterium]|nr:right-handed parallel beta-helix repeat-containing protein [bacterium]
DNNFIISNNIWGMNQDNGVDLGGADYNIIQYNRIHHQQQNGIHFLGSPACNQISRNAIYSNDQSGLWIDSNLDTANYNMISFNNIWGLNQDHGLYINNADYTVVSSNRIHHNRTNGIWIVGSAFSNAFRKNAVYSNNRYGLFLDSDTGDNNLIISNIVYGLNQKTGIRILDGDDTIVYRNLIYRNETNAFMAGGSSLSTRFFNNTVFGCLADGLVFDNTSGATLYNNIILSNGSASGDYGVDAPTTGVVLLSHNLLFGNYAGRTNSGLDWGPANITNTPLLDTVTSFTITSAFSPAVDSATNIPGVSDSYMGSGPDMGWKESPFTYGIVTITSNPPPEIPEAPEPVYDNLDNVKVAPNPFKKNDPEGPDHVVFFYLTPEFDIKIYSVTGAMVSHIQGSSKSGRFNWYVKNEKGEALKPGVYICYVTNSKGQKKTLKLVVIN